MLQKIFTNHHLALVGIGAVSIVGFFYASQPPNESTELNKIKKNINYACKHSQAIVPLKIEREVKRNEQGIDFILKIVNTLQNKPIIAQDEKQKSKDPFLKPFERGIMVQNLPPDHYLVLNKYPIFPNHVLVITKEFQHQENPNTIEDLYQTYKIIRSLEGFAFFNSCQEAGASQTHKHIQVLCNQAFNESNILTTITHVILNDENFESSFDKSALTYRLKAFKRIRHSIRPITDPNDKQHIYNQYLALLRDLNGKQFMTNKSITSMKYNLIMTPKFMMMIERKQEKYKNQISINAVGYTGSILVKNEEQLKVIEEVRIIEILEEVSELETDDIKGINWI